MSDPMREFRYFIENGTSGRLFREAIPFIALVLYAVVHVLVRRNILTADDIKWIIDSVDGSTR